MIKEITLTRADFKTFSRFAFSRLYPKSKSWRRFLVSFVLWLAVFVVLFIGFQSKELRLSDFHWPSALSISVPLLIFIFGFIFNLKKIEKASMPKENGLVLGYRTIEISESGIKYTSKFCTSIYSWSALEGVVIHKGNVYLFLDTMSAQIIPSSAFKSESERAAYVEFIRKCATIYSDQPPKSGT